MKLSLLVILMLSVLISAGQKSVSTFQKKFDPDPNIPIDPLPVFPGDIVEYLKENIRYPEKAYKNKINGRVIVSYVVQADGHVGKVRLKEGIGYGCNKEAVRVIKSMPKWTPAQQNGKNVNSHYTMSLEFNYPDDMLTKEKDRGAEFPYDIKTYLKENTKYPPFADKNNIKGKVSVSFVINENGYTQDVKVEKGIGFGFDEEAMRVIREMPRWKPAIQNGKKVKFYYILTIVFQ